jgi:hypothetical protein
MFLSVNDSRRLEHPAASSQVEAGIISAPILTGHDFMMFGSARIKPMDIKRTFGCS